MSARPARIQIADDLGAVRFDELWELTVGVQGADVCVVLVDLSLNGLQPLCGVSAEDGSFSLEGYADGLAVSL